MFINSLLYATYHLLIAFQAPALASAPSAAATDRASPRASRAPQALLPRYTFPVLFPLSTLSFLLMLIPIGAPSAMQATVTSFWFCAAVACIGWAAVYRRSSKA